MGASLLPLVQARGTEQASSGMFEFIGGSYQSRSTSVDGERTVNLFPEMINPDGGHSKGGQPMVLYGTPGLKSFCTLPEPTIRTLYYQNSRVFAINSAGLYEIQPDGTFAFRGPIVNSSEPASIASNARQLCIVSAGLGYIYDLGNNILTQITGQPWANATNVTFIGGYFVIGQAGSRNFWISGLNDGTTWNGLDFGVKEGASDNLVAVCADHAELVLVGNQTSEIWYLSGAANFPFSKIPGADIEQGTAAWSSFVKLDNTLFWIGSDSRGKGIAWRAAGYVPQRISNHAVEYQWSRYPKISDAVGWGEQHEGHGFFVIWFPTADHTWVFDVASNMWHERMFWDTIHGVEHAHLARCHVAANDDPWQVPHLVGSRIDGRIFRQDVGFFDDDGSPIRRIRRTPHLSGSMFNTFYHSIQVDMMLGVVPEKPLQGSSPIAMMRWSNDGGFTWGNEHRMNLAPIGRYRWRARVNRLGHSRDRVFEFVISEPVDVALIDAYLTCTQGTS